MLRQRLGRKSAPIPAIYYHIARNMRGRHYSFDHIRQMVIRRGLSWEKALQLVIEIETEELAQRPKVHFPARRYGKIGDKWRGVLILIGAMVVLSLVLSGASLLVWLALPLVMLLGCARQC